MALVTSGFTVRGAALAASLLLLAVFAIGGQSPVPAQARICVNDKICASPGLDPSPGLGASPSPSPSEDPSPAPPPEALPTSDAPPEQPAQAAAPSPSAQALQVAARFQNAPFLADLLKVLAHPVAEEKPDLKHFRPATHVNAAAQPAIPRATAPAAGLVELGLMLGAWSLAITVAMVLGQRRRLRLRRLRRLAQLGLLPLLALLVVGMRGTATPGGPDRQLLTPVAGAFGPGIQDTTASIDNLDPLRRSLVPSAPAWNQLVRIETQVAHHQDVLVEQEREIHALATSDASPGPSPDPTPASNEVHDQLSQLLASHDATAEAYHEALKQEYELYVQVAQTPGLAEQLLSAAGQVHSDAGDAISYNLGRVQTQLAQESAISAAETRLAAIGSLSAAQLGAMRHHQPFIVPVQAPVTQGFGATDVWFEPPSTYHGVFYPHFHSGLDVAGPNDAPVHAAADGVVVLAGASQDAQGNLVGYGNYVVVGHPDGFFTLYGHLNSLAVKDGQVVHQGEIVGNEGSTGLSTGPHVHFEIRKGNDVLDPAPFLAGQIPA